MSRTFIRTSAVALLLLATALWGFAPKKKPNLLTSIEPGSWSSAAISLFNTWNAFGPDPERRSAFRSPDGKKLVRIHGYDVTITLGGKEVATNFGVKNNAELGWSKDSSRFFLTWSESGELGPWHVEVYDVSTGDLQEVKDDAAAAYEDFDHRIRSLPRPKSDDQRTWENSRYCHLHVVGSQWLKGSSELLLSVLVPNVGYCRYMSEFNAYRIEVPSGKILERYTARQAHRLFRASTLPLIAK